MSCFHKRSFDYVLSGSKRNIAWRKKMQTEQLRRCTRNVHPSFTDFWPGLGVNFHILLTQNWLWEPSLSLWCILFQTVRFIWKKNKPEEAFTNKKWMVLAKHLLAQAHVWLSAKRCACNFICTWWNMKIKHCWKLFLLEMCCVLASMNTSI